MEALEHREVPAALVWIGGNGDVWNDAANWLDFQFNTNRLPTSNDDLYFGSLGGSNTSSIADIDNLVVASSITDNSFTGTITVASDITVTATNGITSYGNILIEEDATLETSGTFAVYGALDIAGGTNPSVGAYILDMISGSSFYAPSGSGTLDVSLLGIAVGSTWTQDFGNQLTVNGIITSGGVMTLGIPSSPATLTAVGFSTTSTADFDLGASRLVVTGASPVVLGGYTSMGLGSEIEADTVQVEGVGVLESVGGPLPFLPPPVIDGNLEITSGTLSFASLGVDSISVTGNFSVNLGQVNMFVSFGTPDSNRINVAGVVNLNSGGARLNVTNVDAVQTGVTFTLIQCSASGGTGDFDKVGSGALVVPPGLVSAGWVTAGGFDDYNLDY